MSFPALTTFVEIAVTIRKTINSIWLRKVMAAVTFVIAFGMKVVKHLIVKNLILKVLFRDPLNNLQDRYLPFLTRTKGSQ
jgi:hypothetical protein